MSIWSWVGIVVGLTFGIPIFLGLIYDIERCDSRWPNRESSWGFFSGCLVEHKGVMVPEDRVWFERNQ